MRFTCRPLDLWDQMRSRSDGSVMHVTEYREASSSVVLYRGVVPNWRLPSVEDRLYTAVCLALLYERSFRGLHLCLSPDHATLPISSLSHPFLPFHLCFHFFPPSSSFSIFLLFCFFFSFFTRSRVEIAADRGRIGELLSGMEFSELDSWKFLKAYNSNWERMLLASTIS